MSRSCVTATGMLLACAGLALGQDTMYAFNFNGQLARVDLATGAATVIGSGGVQYNAAASDSQGRLWAFHFLSQPGNNLSNLYEVDPNTGAATLRATLNGHGVSNTIRSMDFDANDRLYVTLDLAASTQDQLGTVDVNTGLYTQIGATGKSDIQGLAFDNNGGLWAVGVIANQLYRVDPNTGVATTVGGANIDPDDQALEFDGQGNLYSARSNLKRIDTNTGAATLIGALGAVTDVRGLAFVGTTVRPCYADCDTSTGVGVLDIFDFLCFQNRFAASAGYACDCDTSSGPGVCDIFDFLCFQNAFAAGCP